MHVTLVYSHCLQFFFFNATATTEIYTLSLHDALPISDDIAQMELITQPGARYDAAGNNGVINIKLRKNRKQGWNGDRKSTRLNSSHANISYAVFCLKKKKKTKKATQLQNIKNEQIYIL